MSMRLKREGDWIHYITERGRTFYYNEKDGSFQWEHPSLSNHVPGGHIEDQKSNTSSKSSTFKSDWKPYTDDTTGAVFWYNHVTHISQWECPFEDPAIEKRLLDRLDDVDAANEEVEDQDAYIVQHENDLGI